MTASSFLRAAGAAAFLLAASGAFAQEEGETMKSVLGAIGIIPKEKAPIEYRERPGLVVPQKFELRPPVESAGVEARAPNWPKDPDVAARRRDAVESRRLPTESGSRLLTQQEIAAGRVAGAGAPAASGRPARYNDYVVLTPDEMRAQDPKRTATSKTELAHGVEPQRRGLTDPPAGYRMPASNAPIKATADAPEEANPNSPGAFQREMERRR